MSLFFTRAQTSLRIPTGRIGTARVDTLHRFGCKVCPLNTTKYADPKIEPAGASRPLVYFLGEAPGKNEYEDGEPFVGKSGRTLREHIPGRYEDDVRFGNCIRTWPGPGNPTPEPTAIECCRPSIVRDIEQARPCVIVGLGNVPLYWATGENKGVTKWRGRRFPVRVGGHTCWFYPLFHPSYVMREREKREKDNRRRPSEVERLFRDDMRRVFDEIDDLPDAHVEADPHANIETVTGAGGAQDVKRVAQHLRGLIEAGRTGDHRAALDYETNSLRPYGRVRISNNQALVVHDTPPGWRPRVLTGAVGTYDKTMAFALDHPGAKWSRAQRDEMLALWREFLREYRGRLCAHNTGFEQEWSIFLCGGDPLPTYRLRWDDTMAAAYVNDERSGMLSLDVLCFLHHGFFLKELSQVDVGKLEETPVEEVLKYNALDARHTDWLRDALFEEMDPDLRLLYDKQMERTIAFVLTQYRGVYTSPDAVRKSLAEIDIQVKEIDAKIAADRDVQRYADNLNPAAPKAVGEFFEQLGYREVLRGDGNYDTDKGVLNSIDHPVAELILARRGATKMRSTYIEVFEPGAGRCVYPDGRVHMSYNVNRTATGRTSCQDPNMQNMPKRDQGFRTLRRQFVARAGNYLIAADYGQIEARVIAMASKDKSFVQALWDDYDVHMEWAERVARAYPERLDRAKSDKDPKGLKTLRGDIKNQLVFPAFFGAGIPKISSALGVPQDIIAPLFEDFWDVFSGVRDWQQRTIKFYEAHGYVECLTYGRRRRAPIDYNQILNTPVQGTASDIVVDAQCDLVRQAMETGREWLVPVLNVHDDITSDVPEAKLDDALEVIIGTMLKREYDFLNVPLQVEVEIGRDWYDMKAIGKFRSDQW